MRGIAGPAALLLSLAACFQANTTYCPQTGAECPDGLACAPAPVFCGSAANVAACAGKATYTSCANDQVCISAVCTPCTDDIEGCGSAGWNPMTSASEPLNAVWVAGVGDAYAVGQKAMLLHYDGSTWSAPSLPTFSRDISLNSVWGTDSNNVFAVGDGGVVLHYDGNWIVDSSWSYPFAAVWGTAATNVVAVGNMTGRGFVRRFDGQTWTTDIIPSAPALYAAGGTGPDDIYAVGAGGTILHYDGATWSTLAGYVMSAPDLYGVWGDASTGETYVVGGGGTSPGLVVRYHDGAPTPECPQCNTLLRTVWGNGSGEVFTGGSAVLASTSDGQSWTTFTTVPDASADVFGIAGSQGSPAVPVDVFAVGANGVIWHYTGP
jgi:hypothetical protein